MYIVLNRHTWYAKILTKYWPRCESKIFGRWQVEQARYGTDTTNFYMYVIAGK